ncbi:MAG: hypothetical protein HHJ18_20315 [Polaromonas sp.]|nr:hypothetical protein [Polaromonas sp.]
MARTSLCLPSQQPIADALGLHELTNVRLRLLNPRALERIAEYYDRLPEKLPLL